MKGVNSKSYSTFNLVAVGAEALKRKKKMYRNLQDTITQMLDQLLPQGFNLTNKHIDWPRIKKRGYK